MTTPTCSARGCGRLAASRNRYCRGHALRLNRYGHIHAMPLRDSELRPLHEWVAAGFERHAHRRATQAALTLAERLLAYRPTHGFGVQHKAAAVMQKLTDAGVTPRDVLIRVTVFYALLQRRAFPSQKAEEFALARLVIRLGGPRRRRDSRPSARLLQYLGPLIREHCALYAGALLREIEREADDERALKAASINFDDDREETTNA